MKYLVALLIVACWQGLAALHARPNGGANELRALNRVTRLLTTKILVAALDSTPSELKAKIRRAVAKLGAKDSRAATNQAINRRYNFAPARFHNVLLPTERTDLRAGLPAMGAPRMIYEGGGFPSHEVHLTGWPGFSASETSLAEPRERYLP